VSKLSQHLNKSPVKALNPEKRSRPVKTCQDLSRPVKTCQDLSRPVKTCQDLSRPVKTCRDLSRPVETCRDLSRPVETCQDLSRPVKTCQDLSRPFKTCQDLSRPNLFGTNQFLIKLENTQASLPLVLEVQNWCKLKQLSSRCDTGLVHDLQLTWASGESETKGKGEKVCGSNLML
jgi:hypothetical protein